MRNLPRTVCNGPAPTATIGFMESTATPPASRRTEDIALDLLKFVAGHANLGSASGSKTPGFAAPSASKTEDQVDHIFELYSRCRAAVEAPLDK